jgi:hypothetical protein
MTQPGTRPDRRQNPGAPAVGLLPGPGIHRRGVLAAVSLPDGRALAVRTVTEADAEGLHALFEGLSDDDRHHRFFNLCHPDRKFLKQLTRPEDEGGYRLVAVVPGPEGAVVAEAGYAILPGGDGEFALTVAHGWRGWLGTYPLDAIVAAAAARGVPNLQADIMLDNPRMLALVSHRGHITLDRGALSEVRVAIDAAQPARRTIERLPSRRNALGLLGQAGAGCS